MQDRHNFALLQLDRVLGFVPKAEGKVTTLFPVAVAMLGIIALKAPVQEPLSWRSVTGAIAAACLGMCLWRIYETLFPQLRAPRPSPTFFGEIAKRSEQEYIDQIKAVTADVLVEDAASQVWRNSEIVSKKFGKAKAAFHWVAFALPPWLLFLVLVTLKDGKTPFPGG